MKLSGLKVKPRSMPCKEQRNGLIGTEKRYVNTLEVTVKVNYLEREVPALGFLVQDFLSGVAELVKEGLARAHVHQDKVSCWQLILLQSKVKRLFLSWGRSSPSPLGVAQEHLVSGTAESWSQRSRSCGTVREEPKMSAMSVAPGSRTKPY
jgi:hypothetical protein